MNEDLRDRDLSQKSKRKMSKGERRELRRRMEGFEAAMRLCLAPKTDMGPPPRLPGARFWAIRREQQRAVA
ncbi:MAG: hypothetical protein WD489_10980 [Rhodovibrionaceae bacterium]